MLKHCRVCGREMKEPKKAPKPQPEPKPLPPVEVVRKVDLDPDED